MLTRFGIHASAHAGVSLGTFLGSATDTVAGTSLVITTTAAIAIDDLVVVRVAADNLSDTTPTFTCADSGGNAYTAHAFWGRNVTAGLGVVGAILATKATAAVAAGGTITLTLSGSVTDKAAYVESFTGFKNVLSRPADTNGGASSSAVAGAVNVANVGELVVAAIAAETRTPPNFDTDTTYGEWVGRVSVPSSTSGTDDTRVEINGQSKLVTGAGIQTYNNTGLPTGTDYAGMLALFRPTVATDFYEPFTTADAWAFSGTIVAGRNGNALQIVNSAQIAEYSIPADLQSDTITVGFAWRYTDASTAKRTIASLRSDAGAVTHGTLAYTASSTTLAFYRGSQSGTLLASNAAVTFVQNTWYYIELQVKLHDTTGTVQVRVDGVDVIALTTGLDTKNAGTKTVYDALRLWNAVTTCTGQWDDLYLVMGAGAAFKGDIVVP